MPERDRDNGERRQLTVLFCDVARSAQILESLDEEDWRDSLRAYHRTCERIIERYDGHVAQYLGDGILAYFGYPTSHENNAQRALKAAIEVVAQIDSINNSIAAAIGEGRVTLTLRVAAHTGTVIVDDLRSSGRSERLALGMVPTVAARLQAEAPDNAIVISESTYRLVHASFNCTCLGPLTLKGISAPQIAYRVDSEREFKSRFDAGTEKGLTPFVGREEELSALMASWTAVQAGAGRVVLIDGDPGIGKSRLVQEFGNRLEDECYSLSCSCSPYYRNSAYFPVIQLLHALLGVKSADGDDVKLQRLEAAIEEFDSRPDSVAVVGRMLSLRSLSNHSEQKLSASHEKQRLHEIVVDWLRTMSKRSPVRLFIEDMHWIDPSSQELFERVAASAAEARLLMLIAFRPECAVNWTAPHVERLVLGSLLERDAEQMLRNLQQERNLPLDVVRRLIANTDGVPLFLEESAIMMLTNERSDSRAVPSTLHDLLMARLDQLDTARPLAQIAATIGHEFSFELLSAVTSMEEIELRSQIDQLQAARLICDVDSGGSHSYAFKHALVRDTAYFSLMSRTRKHIHRRVAEVLCEKFPDVARSQPELVAHHFAEAGQTQLAVDHLQKAGVRSTERYELKEAVRHLRSAHDLIAQLPRTETRLRQELDIKAMFAGRLIATEGYGAADVETTYTEALELAHELGDTQRRLQMTLGLESFHFMRSNFQMAHRLADQCMVLARQLGDPVRSLIVHWVLGEISFHQADFVACEAHLSECINDYKKSYHRPRTLQDPAVMSLSYCSWVHWLQGHPERALDTIGKAITLAEELSHPFSRSVAYSFAAGLHLFRGEIASTRAYAEQAIRVCTEHGFPVWLAFCTVVNGRAQVSEGDIEAGVREMEEGLRIWTSSGAVVTTPYYHALLAEGLAVAGMYTRGLEHLASAQTIVDRSGERYYEPEIHRLRGELRLQMSNDGATQNEAEKSFNRAVDLAKQQGSHSLELRALTSLARLQRLKRTDASAFSRLRDISSAFGEGSNTADVLAARQVLAECS